MRYEKNNQWIKHIDFVVLDLFCIELSLFIANLIRFGSTFFLTDGNTYARLALMSAVLMICYIFFAEPYSGILRRDYLAELKAVIVNNAGLIILLVVCLFILHTTKNYSRLVLAYFIVINIIITYCCHVFQKRHIRKRANVSDNAQELLLVLQAKDVKKCVDRLLKNPYGTTKLSGIIIVGDEIITEVNSYDGTCVMQKTYHNLDEFKKGSKISSVTIVGNEEDLISYCKLNVVDDVLFYNSIVYLKKYQDILLNMGIRVHCNVVELEENYLKYQVKTINGIMTLSTSITSPAIWQKAVKRAMDIVGGLLGCIMTGLIAMVVFPVIKIQAPGPVFFSQIRIGKNGRKFKIYKFRSMYTDAEERKKDLMANNKMQGFMFKMDNDPRIFPFGNFLRKTSLDEFPQFYNVLKGEMSMCGTRPPTLDEYIQYAPHHKSRLAMKPGITGLWQVSGRSEITDFEEVVRLDNEYIRNWNLSLDLKILLKTIFVVFKRKGSE